MPYDKERRIAIDAVLDACRLCRNVAAELVSQDTLAKKDKSPVTVADFGAQAVVTDALRRAFADDPMVGEEDAAELRQPEAADLKDKVIHHVRRILPDADESHVLSSIDFGTHSGGAAGRLWTLDPIDGTKGFLRGDQFAIALALIQDGRPVLGVLGCPNLPLDAAKPDGHRGCLFVAVDGDGAVMRPIDADSETHIGVTDITDVTRAAFCESVESGHSSHDDAARIAEILTVTAPPFRIDSQCKYAAVARGDASIYLRLPTSADYEEKIWDHAAGWMVVTEAGGRVTDTRGEPLDFSIGRTLKNNKGVVATNGRLHDEVIAAVRDVLGV